jgi:hypothetical protein
MTPLLFDPIPPHSRSFAGERDMPAVIFCIDPSWTSRCGAVRELSQYPQVLQRGWFLLQGLMFAKGFVFVALADVSVCRRTKN